MSALQQSMEQLSEERELSEPALERANGAGPKRPVSGIERAIDRFPARAFLVLSAFYVVVELSLSWMKLLWLDELITLHIAQLGGTKAIWQALERGVDPNPPVTYLLVHASRALFGDHEMALRLPAAVGYWVGMLCLFLYLKRRLSGTWALAGTVLSMAMAAFDYSFESRSYGIFYGLAMLAFLCWTYAVDAMRSETGRVSALLGMTAALAAGISTNYFAVLAFFPVAAAEFVRTVLRVRVSRFAEDPGRRSGIPRAIDWRIWIAFVVAASPLIAYRPLIEKSIAQFAPHAWNKVSLGQVADSYTEMVEVVLYPLLALFVMGIVVWVIARRMQRVFATCRERLVPRWIRPVFAEFTDRFPLPVDEVAGVFCFMAYPFLGYAVASIRGGMLSPRFVIPVCFGFAIAGTFVAFQLFRSYRYAGLVFLSFMMAWFICRESYVGFWYEEQKQCFYKIVSRIPQADLVVPAGAPIAIPDPLLALTFQHYAPKQYAQREIFPVDFPAVRFFRHDDSPEENLWAGRGFMYSLPIVPLAEFQSHAGDYLIITGDSNWMLEDLRRHFYNVKHLSIDTHAGAIGGFTPLAHGTPMFYTAKGDLADFGPLAVHAVPFKVADNLPSATQLPQIEVNP